MKMLTILKAFYSADYWKKEPTDEEIAAAIEEDVDI